MENPVLFVLVLSPQSVLLFSILMLVLIACSALISGSEVAYFGLTSNNIRALEEENSDSAKQVLSLKENSEQLLATILISNNFVNIALVIVSQIVLNELLGQERLNSIATFLDQNVLLGALSPEQVALGLQFFITTVLVTIILLLLGEIAPKHYATTNKLTFAKMMGTPLRILNICFFPISILLVKWSARMESRINTNRSYQTGTSKEDLDAAIDLTVTNDNNDQQEADILKGIIKFGEVSAKQIMKPRLDVVALDLSLDYTEVLKIVRDSGYSRIPVYDDEMDNIRGMLYVKDLLGHTSEGKDFEWQAMVRDTVMYVPESKHIDDLLADFQARRMHMAIVVNEFGGTLGIITLEDIMEEVIGDIHDEFDEEEDIDFVKLDDHNYIFEGKTLLNDVCRIISEKIGYFDDIKDNADSIGGLIVEKLGFIPRVEREITLKDITFKIISVTNRRIERVNLKINSNPND